MILKDTAELFDSYDDSASQRESLQARLRRLQEMYEWGHKTKEEYLMEHDEIQAQLQRMSPPADRSGQLERLAQFLASVATAWAEASQHQRNKLAGTLFDEIWVDDTRVTAVKPRPELEPFFKLNLECHNPDIAGDPDGIRNGDLEENP